MRIYWILLGTIFIGCVSPSMVSNEFSPQLNTCPYKTYTIQEPDDQTRLRLLSDPARRKALEDVIRDSLRTTGLTEVSIVGPADLQLHYSILDKEMKPTQSTGTVIMASEYRLGTLTVELWDKETRIWQSRLQQVVGDIRSSNLQRAQDALAKAFAEYPACSVKK